MDSKLKNIAIVETHYHEEFISTLCSIFNNANKMIFTTLKVKNNLPNYLTEKESFVICNEKGSKISFIKNISVDEFDTVFVNTIQPSMVDIPLWNSYPISDNSILTLHNLNAWYNKKFIPRLNIAHSIDSFISSKVSGSILSKFGTINVVYEPMIRFAKTRFPFHKIIHIPFTLAQDNIVSESHDILDFVIPGTVTHSRRDYNIVFKVFDKLYLRNKSFRLVLLGKPDGVDIGSRKYIVSFDSRVPEEEYNKYLRNADFVICPSVKEIHTVNVVTEQYGQTKSNNLYDAIKWRKPLITPWYIPIPESIESSTRRYVDFSDLLSGMYSLLTDKDSVEKLKNEAVKNTEVYTCKRVKQSLHTLVS